VLGGKCLSCRHCGSQHSETEQERSGDFSQVKEKERDGVVGGGWGGRVGIPTMLTTGLGSAFRVLDKLPILEAGRDHEHPGGGSRAENGCVILLGHARKAQVQGQTRVRVGVKVCLE
jgi:hypothetical protein